MRVLAALVFALTLVGAAARAQEDVGDSEKGHAFALTICAKCHAVDADQATSPNPSAPTFKRIAAEPGMTATALFVILQNPHREMPDLILEREEMRNVVAYILTLKAN
jgi:mono/diheme cytochrome c family protein